MHSGRKLKTNLIRFVSLNAVQKNIFRAHQRKQSKADTFVFMCQLKMCCPGLDLANCVQCSGRKLKTNHIRFGLFGKNNEESVSLQQSDVKTNECG